MSLRATPRRGVSYLAEMLPIRDQLLATLKRLVDLSGPSGSEQSVLREVLALVRPLADTVEVDSLGNLVATRRAADPGARRCLLAAHLDEVGFQVRSISEDGLLRFEKLGGFDDRVLLAQRVWVQPEGGERLLGVIGCPSAHHRLSPGHLFAAHELAIDVGARDADHAESMGIRPGDPAGLVGELTELGAGSGRYTGHALDDRAGCAALLCLLEQYRDTPPPATILALFTVQEEVGLRGAQAASRALRAEVALALDMTAADDLPMAPGETSLRLGSGPAIKYFDASTLPHPAVRKGLRRAAERIQLSSQAEALGGIGTDAGALQWTGAACPSGAVSVANRYTHSPAEVLDLGDLVGMVQLLRAFLEDLPALDLRFLGESHAAAG